MQGSTLSGAPKRSGSALWLLAGFLAVASLSLPLALPALDSFFTFDDLQNLNYYVARPTRSLLANLQVATSLRRPLGALFYLPIHELFGMNPKPLYVAGLTLFYLNLALFFRLALRLTESPAAALIGLAVFGLHPHLHNVLYNFGAVYELTAMTTCLAALLCYIRYTETLRRGWYFQVLFWFLVGLNAKETMVALPGILAAYEILYRQNGSPGKVFLARLARRISPLLAILVPYTLAKTLGPEALWRDNPLYRMHFDLTIVRNSVAYLTELSYGSFHVSFVTGGLVILSALGLAALLKNRHMGFGLALAAATLAPVLPLPRVWGLFLYLPLAGLGLYFGALAADLGRRVAARARGGLQAMVPTLRLVTALALGFLMLSISLPAFEAARQVNYFGKTFPWRDFAHQFYQLQPNLDKKTILAFLDPPFEFDQPDRWCLNFLIWLKYGDQSIRVYRLPQHREEFIAAARSGGQVGCWEWRSGTLRQVGLEQFLQDSAP